VLLEVVWASGRMLREYTLFLDPPTFDSPAPQPAVTPTPQPAITAAPQPEPVETLPVEVQPEPEVPFQEPASTQETITEGVAISEPVDEEVSVEPKVATADEPAP